ncbi:MAG: hypothetical protein ACOCRX_09490 [Candidatus Woesearchaeota archaeon]
MVLEKKPWFITAHSLKRLNERLGEEYWTGMKIKNMSPNQQRNFILKSLNKSRVRTVRKDRITYLVETRYFTAIVVPGLKFNKIETIYEVNRKRDNKILTYNLKEILNKKSAISTRINLSLITD